MKALSLAEPGQDLRILCLGAHSDDIEIGAGGTILSFIERGVRLHVYWAVGSAIGHRAQEAKASAHAFLDGAQFVKIELGDFRDSYFPNESDRLKQWVEQLRTKFTPDVIFTHRKDDAHQDHRELSRLTWNAFRDHIILEYEIPKWDGDLGQPNLYQPLSRRITARKTELLTKHFGSQRSKDWFDDETFEGLARLRGLECRAEDRYAEAFYIRKLRLW